MFVVRIYLMMLRVVIFFLSFFVNCILIIIIIIISLNISQRERISRPKKNRSRSIFKRERERKNEYFSGSHGSDLTRVFFSYVSLHRFFFVLFYVIRSTESATEFLIFCSLFSSTSTSCVMMTTKKKSSSSLNKDDEDN